MSGGRRKWTGGWPDPCTPSRYAALPLMARLGSHDAGGGRESAAGQTRPMIEVASVAPAHAMIEDDAFPC
jgi:hypothetical protein